MCVDDRIFITDQDMEGALGIFDSTKNRGNVLAPGERLGFGRSKKRWIQRVGGISIRAENVLLYSEARKATFSSSKLSSSLLSPLLGALIVLLLGVVFAFVYRLVLAGLCFKVEL